MFFSCNNNTIIKINVNIFLIIFNKKPPNKVAVYYLKLWIKLKINKNQNVLNE